jgi:hypothetical protein
MKRRTADLVAELTEATDEELYAAHGIELYADGTVYDTVEDITYSSLLEWVESQESTMLTTTFVKKQQRARFDE